MRECPAAWRFGVSVGEHRELKEGTRSQRSGAVLVLEDRARSETRRRTRSRGATRHFHLAGIVVLGGDDEHYRHDDHTHDDPTPHAEPITISEERSTRKWTHLRESNYRRSPVRNTRSGSANDPGRGTSSRQRTRRSPGEHVGHVDGLRHSAFRTRGRQRRPSQAIREDQQPANSVCHSSGSPQLSELRISSGPGWT